MRQQINAAGGDMTYLQLPSAGLHGNSHMFMQDKNNLKVADLLIKWIDQHVKRKGRDDDDDDHHPIIDGAARSLNALR